MPYTSISQYNSGIQKLMNNYYSHRHFIFRPFEFAYICRSKHTGI